MPSLQAGGHLSQRVAAIQATRSPRRTHQPQGMGRRQGPEVQLTECRWAHACCAGSGRLRSAPRRTAPATHRRRSGSLWAGSACLHSRHANELLVPNQRRTPAGGEAGATIFIPLYPFSYWPQPRLDQLLFHLSAELFADIQRLREEQGLQALTARHRSTAALFPLPNPSGTVWASRRRPDLLLLLFPWSRWKAANPTCPCPPAPNRRKGDSCEDMTTGLPSLSLKDLNQW